jgi:hypothetical protein
MAEHKRVIIVPRTKESNDILYYGNDEGVDRQANFIELYLTEREYNELDKEIFDKLNIVMDTLIDDYEIDEVVGKKSIEKGLNFLKKLEGKSQLANEITNLFEEAYNRDTGVYFFF